jgi:hypothetical protein
MGYSDKLKSPKWQKKRLQILDRDNWQCQYCKDTERQLQVHHLKYTNEPWDANNEDLITTCIDCHSIISKFEFVFKSILKIKLIDYDNYKFICKGEYKNGVEAVIFVLKYDDDNIVSIGFNNKQINNIKDFI